MIRSATIKGNGVISKDFFTCGLLNRTQDKHSLNLGCPENKLYLGSDRCNKAVMPSHRLKLLQFQKDLRRYFGIKLLSLLAIRGKFPKFLQYIFWQYQTARLPSEFRLKT